MKTTASFVRILPITAALAISVHAQTPPVIRSFTPGSARAGATVTITGLNFSPTVSSNIVYFGAVRAPVIGASTSNLTVSVPAGATFAPITETANGLTAYADQPFQPTFPGSGQINSSSLGTPLVLPTGIGPGQVIIADFDGDGRADLVIADGGAGDISIYQNISTNGTLAFALRLSMPMMPGNGFNPFSVAVGDLDGDGRLDIVAINADSNVVSVLRNISTPGVLTTNSFAPRLDLPGGSGMRGATIRDLNGDGKPDIAVVNWNDNTVSVFQNQSTIGNISFAARQNFAVGSNPSDVAIADLDGDGYPDIAVANMNSATISALRNLGTGATITSNSFAPQVILSTPGQCYDVKIGDVDGDGKPDILTANWAGNISVLRNLTSGPGITAGSFASHVDFSLGGWGNGIALGDLDGDGKPDIAAVSQLNSLLSLFHNASTPGNFTISSLSNRVDFASGFNPAHVVLGDLNGDGKLDVVFGNDYSSNVYIYPNIAPSPTPPTITSFAPASAFTGSNVTISGLNFSPVASNNIVYFGGVRAVVTAASTTSLTVTVPVGATYAPITETVNGLTAYSGQAFLPTFLGNGQISSSSLGPQVILPSAGNGPIHTLIADVDGDGKPDLIVANNYSGGISIFRNTSTNSLLTTNSFALPVVLQTGTGTFGANPYKIVAADLDGDGRLDIVALNADSNIVSIFPNTSSPGNISFGSRMDLPAGNTLRGLAVRDLNGDGKPDIVTGNYGENTVSIYQNQSTIGNISFASRINLAAGHGPQVVAIGDADGDGNPDIAVVNSDDETISVFRNLGGGGTISTNSFAPQVAFSAPTGSYGVTIGDVDGDGKQDILATGNSEQLSVYRNTATVGSITTNSFAAPVNFGLGGWGHNIALGDLSGDGKPDVVVDTELNSLLSIFHNQSTPGNFTTNSLGSRVDFPTGYNAWGVSVGDLNGDGRPDIVFANAYDNTISIYPNSTTIPAPPTITSEPEDAYVYAYSNTTFSVTATGASSYQWFFNGSSLLNATTSTLTVSSAEQSNLGPYWVIASNNYGAVTSSIANLFMYPFIATPFAGLVTDWGQNTSLSVGAWGSGNLTYQWYDNGVAIPNATNSTLTFAAIQFTNAGSYSVVVSSSLGSVTNTAAQVVVNPAGVSLGLYPGLTITGTVGYTYNIQSNPDLTNPNGWTTVATVTLWQPTQFWVDVNSNAASPTNQHRFYRVLPVQ